MSRDILSNVKAVHSILPGAKVTGGSPYNGTGVDLSAYGSNEVVAYTGTVTDGTHTITLEESDDNSSFSAVAAENRQGSLPPTLDTTAAHDNAIFRFAYIGKKRYIRAVCVTAGTTTGAVLGVMVLLGNPRHGPVSAN